MIMDVRCDVEDEKRFKKLVTKKTWTKSTKVVFRLCKRLWVDNQCSNMYFWPCKPCNYVFKHLISLTHAKFHNMVAKNNRYFLTFKMMIKIDFVNLYTIRNCILKKNFKNRWILIRFGDDVCQFFSFFFLTKSCLVFSAMKQRMMNPMTGKCQKDVSM